MSQWNEPSALLDIGMCGTHTIQESLTNAEKASESDIGKLLKSISKILLKKSLTLIFIQCHCGHKWCENENCLHRSAETWPAFNTLVNHLM